MEALAHLQLKDPAAAVPSLQAAIDFSGAEPFLAASLAKAQALAGQMAEARKTISSLPPASIQGIQVLHELAGAYLVLGEEANCYALRERSVVENGCTSIWC